MERNIDIYANKLGDEKLGKSLDRTCVRHWDQ
jgi:hypothetical protein